MEVDTAPSVRIALSLVSHFVFELNTRLARVIGFEMDTILRKLVINLYRCSFSRVLLTLTSVREQNRDFQFTSLI